MQHNIFPNRQLVPRNNRIEELSLQNPQHHRLDNKLDLYLIEAGDEDVVRIDLVINAGSVHQSKKLCASFTNALVKEGTKNLSSDQIAQLLDFYGAYLNTSISKDKAVISLFSLTKHLEKLLPLFKEIITQPVYPLHEFEVHRDRSRQEFLINSEKARHIANREFNKLIFGDNSAYGQYLKINDYELLHKEDLTRFHSSYYTPQNSYLIVSGKPDDNSKKLIVDLFGNSWPRTNSVTKAPSNICSDPFKGEILIKKADFMQSALRIGKRVIGKLDPDYPKLLFTNTVLGGYFGSRLMTNLREDKGMTYGIHSFMSHFKHASYFSIATEVKVEQTSAAIAEIKKEIDILQNDKISNDELILVKNYIYGNFLKNFDGPFALAEMFRSARDIEKNFEFFSKNLNEIMTLTANDVLTTAQKHLDINDMCSLIVGNSL
jgi:predicted Zn-dependent peptidase